MMTLPKFGPKILFFNKKIFIFLYFLAFLSYFSVPEYQGDLSSLIFSYTEIGLSLTP